MSRLLFEARAAVLALEAQERVLEKEIELAKLKTFVGLTDEDIDELVRKNFGYIVAWQGPFARAIEAKLREKNGGGK